MRDIRYRLDNKSGIATLVIDTAGPVNSIGGQFIDDLAVATESAYKDKISGMIICSAKDTSFLDGADLLEIRRTPSSLNLKHMVMRLHEICDALAQGPFPVAAVLCGQTALGGGFELILWTCDRIFATPASKMGLPEVGVGLFPALGGAETLKRIMGFETALTLIMEGNVRPAAFFQSSGVVQILSETEIFVHARRWLHRNAGIQNRNTDPARTPPDDLRPADCRRLIQAARDRYTRCPERPYFAAALNAMEEGLDLSFRDAVENQVRHFAPLIADVHVQDKIDAFFTVTSVAPRLATSEPGHVLDVSQAAVIGAGLMGRGIAQVCADAGMRVLLFDLDQAAAEKARQRIGERLDALVQKGR
jgi:3-hydroxyacyl-CoA dehydrogenase/enoyl-CoA hydratase/3-hydroxybutyryl-CoA epimerase